MKTRAIKGTTKLPSRMSIPKTQSVQTTGNGQVSEIMMAMAAITAKDTETMTKSKNQIMSSLEPKTEILFGTRTFQIRTFS
jgi:hypothetical protein